MLGYLISFVMVAATIGVSRSSCHRDNESADNLQSQPSMVGGIGRTGYGIVPRQQIEPRIQPMPRR
ncbi:hypothetical protein D3C85_1506690 [compost metagenome]